jgi:hypothetical protein
MLVVVVCFSRSHFGGTLCFGGRELNLLKNLQKMELNGVQIIVEFSIELRAQPPLPGSKVRR